MFTVSYSYNIDRDVVLDVELSLRGDVIFSISPHRQRAEAINTACYHMGRCDA